MTLGSGDVLVLLSAIFVADGETTADLAECRNEALLNAGLTADDY